MTEYFPTEHFLTESWIWLNDFSLLSSTPLPPAISTFHGILTCWKIEHPSTLWFWDLFKNNVLSVIIVAGGFILPFTLWLWASSYFHYPSYWGYFWSSYWLLGSGKEEIISHSWFLAFIFILSFLQLLSSLIFFPSLDPCFFISHSTMAVFLSCCLLTVGRSPRTKLISWLASNSKTNKQNHCLKTV